ncbi:hypothetical protein [Glycomyces albidus]|jgi:hypothetical protein|uniref:Uncharacterized protein n=1 Tax=Glycomyces albidus TaxID=2656774 RepID=A0A6L5G9X5_9ACTN|nr:hypothetical protein [Glycomyces albidus]MQM26378.1 hypothetical protein [Glycomyces albidus]
MTSGSTAYFGVLDTVNFQPDLPELELANRTLNATGAVMLHMILGGVHPVLSQSQAFDSAPLVSTLARMDEDSLAMIGLARRGSIQVRILDSPGLADDPADGQRFTLLNAFRSALLQPEFRFSSWPELGADMALRRAVAEQLDRDPERVGAIAEHDLLHRLLGLIEFDQALRDSPVSERATIANGADLADQVLGAVSSIRRTSGGADTDMLTLLQARVQEARDPARFRRRSAWYALLDEYEDAASQDASAAGQLELVRGLVNAKYNGIVAASLGADGLDVEIPDFRAAQIVARAGTEHLVGARSAQVLDHSDVGAWLTWSELQRTLTLMQDIRVPQSRYRFLVGKYREYDVGRRMRSQPGGQIWAHVRAAPINALGAAVGGIVGLAIGNDAVGTVVGSLIGTAGGVYANVVLDKFKERALGKAALKAQRESDQVFTPVLGRGSIAYRIDDES